MPSPLPSFAVLALACSALAAQPQPTLRAAKTDTPPVIDGDLSDACWKTAPSVTGFLDIQNGNTVADQTVAYAIYDDKYLYFAFECRDSKPDAIVARETVRDALFNSVGQGNQYPLSEDYVQVSLDAFHTGSQADESLFAVNPIGTRAALFSGGRAAKAEWGGDWDAAAKRTATGWTCEMRIPWRAINRPESGKPIDMGIDFARFQYRTQLFSMWSSLGPNIFWNDEGLWSGVMPPAASHKRELSLLPYVLEGVANGQINGKTGFDARYSITPQLTAVGTLNPDFSQVEGAIQTIQFQHKTPYLADNRPFFTEGGNFFTVPMQYNDPGALFYSTAITHFEAGTKVYGKIDPQDEVGLLGTFDPTGNDNGVMRYLHNFNQTSSQGAMVVTSEQPGLQNTVAEADDHFRWGKAGFETMLANSVGAGAGGGLQVVSSYYADKALVSLLQYSAIDDHFLTPVGYIPYKGYKGIFETENYGVNWRKGPWRNFGGGIGFIDLSNTAGGQYWKGSQSAIAWETRTDWHLEADYTSQTFLGTNDNSLGLNFIYGATNQFRQIGLQVLSGESGSVHSTFVSPTASFRVFKHLDLLYAGAFQNRAGLTQQHVVTMNYELSPTRSFGGRIVTQNRDTNVYLFYHNSGGKGTEFYVLYGDPNAQRSVNVLQVKVVFALNS